jgi:hypothetical protein
MASRDYRCHCEPPLAAKQSRGNRKVRAGPPDCLVAEPAPAKAGAANKKEFAPVSKPVIASRRLAAWRSRAASTVLSPLDCFVAKRLLAMAVALSSMVVGRRPVGNSRWRCI